MSVGSIFFDCNSIFCDGPRSRSPCGFLMWVFFKEIGRGEESVLSFRGLADFGDFGWRDHGGFIAESVPHIGQDSSDFFVVELLEGGHGNLARVFFTLHLNWAKEAVKS